MSTSTDIYLNPFIAKEQGLLTEFPFNFLPSDKTKWIVDRPYVDTRAQLFIFHGEKLHDICIHLKYENECDHEDCTFSKDHKKLTHEPLRYISNTNELTDLLKRGVLNLPDTRDLYLVNIPYLYKDQLNMFDGKQFHKICIHLKYKWKCDVESCMFSLQLCAESRKAALLNQYPNLNVKKYCRHFHVSKSCSLCSAEGHTSRATS